MVVLEVVGDSWKKGLYWGDESRKNLELYREKIFGAEIANAQLYSTWFEVMFRTGLNLACDKSEFVLGN